MAGNVTVDTLASALTHFRIKRIGKRDLLNIVEDEFAYFPLEGERFTFLLIHDGTPERFAKDFRAFLNCLAFKGSAYEQDVKKHLKAACEAVERMVFES